MTGWRLPTPRVSRGRQGPGATTGVQRYIIACPGVCRAAPTRPRHHGSRSSRFRVHADIGHSADRPGIRLRGSVGLVEGVPVHRRGIDAVVSACREGMMRFSIRYKRLLVLASRTPWRCFRRSPIRRLQASMSAMRRIFWLRVRTGYVLLQQGCICGGFHRVSAFSSQLVWGRYRCEGTVSGRVMTIASGRT